MGQRERVRGTLARTRCRTGHHSHGEFGFCFFPLLPKKGRGRRQRLETRGGTPEGQNRPLALSQNGHLQLWLGLSLVLTVPFPHPHAVSTLDAFYGTRVAMGLAACLATRSCSSREERGYISAI